MKRLFSFLLPLIVAFSCNAQEEKTKSTPSTVVADNVNVKEAKELISTGDVVIIDVRTPEEYVQGHLANSNQINFYDPDFREQIEALDKDAEYLVYCRSGGRSGKAMSLMSSLGFSKVHNLEGGFTKWMKEGAQVIK